MEITRKHGRRILFILAAALALLALIGGMVAVMKSRSKTLNELHQSGSVSSLEHGRECTALDEHKGMYGHSQGQEADTTGSSPSSNPDQKVDAPVANFVFSSFRLSRRHVIGLSIGVTLLVAIAAAIAVFVLYQQDQPTDPATTVDEEDYQRILEQKKLEMEQEEDTGQEAAEARWLAKKTTKMASGGEKPWYWVRAGAFFGILGTSVVVGMIFRYLERSKAWIFIFFSWVALEMAAVIALGIMNGTTGFLYGVAAAFAGISLIWILAQSALPEDDKLRMSEARYSLVILFLLFMVTLPIIHMGALGVDLWAWYNNLY